MEGYVVVATVQGQFAEAQLRSFLDGHGIATRVRGETLRTTHGIAVDGLGQVAILVPEAQAANARDLLARAEHGDFAISEESETR